MTLASSPLWKWNARRGVSDRAGAVDDRLGDDGRIRGIGGRQRDALAREIEAVRVFAGTGYVPWREDDVRPARPGRRNGVFDRGVVGRHQQVVDESSSNSTVTYRSASAVHGHHVGIAVPGGVLVGPGPLLDAVARIGGRDERHGLERVVLPLSGWTVPWPPMTLTDSLIPADRRRSGSPGPRCPYPACCRCGS